MNRTITGVMAGLVLSLGPGFGLNAADLPPEHEVRRLIIAVDAAISEDRWDDASRHLSRLQNLDAKKPADYQFLRGRVMLQADQLNEAQSALEAYVTQAGVEGKYYDRALQLITQVEDRHRDNPRGEPMEKIAVIEPAERVDIEALKSLYLETSDRGAMVAHLNSLLSLNAWQPGPVIRSEPAESVRYQVDIGADSALQIKELVSDQEDGPILSTQTIPVYGINPAITHTCFDTGNSCWLYDPRDQSRWLRLLNRPEPAAEIARVLSDLIRNLQQGSS